MDWTDLTDLRTEVGKADTAVEMDGTKPLVGLGDLGAFDPAKALGEPGKYSFARGVHQNVCRRRLWTMR